jgi:TonB-dependent receptor
MPSLNATMHFTPQLQLRAGYTYNVERPSLFALRPFAFFETRATPPIVYAGNPDLKPNEETSYDLSLEYYFGRAGSISLAAYLKKQNGFIYESGIEGQPIPELGTTGTVVQPRNAGPGEFQGYEFAAQGFFEFLPGNWKNLGGSINATYIPKFRIDFPYSEEEREIPGIFDAPGTSKYTYNATLFYDTPKVSARVAYNYRARRKDMVDVNFLEYSLYTLETSRLDAALNYTPIKQLTVSLEGTNLLGEHTTRYWGVNRYMPVGPRLEAKTIQLGARFRF